MHTEIFEALQLLDILLLKREPDNLVDASAVAVWKEDKIVGHVPYNIASVISQFLTRGCNKGFVQVNGNKVNRGAGYGLEVPCTAPCTYRLYDPRPFIERITQIVQSLQEKRLLLIATVLIKLLRCFRSLAKFNLNRFYAVYSRFMSSMQARMRTCNEGTAWQLPLRC